MTRLVKEIMLREGKYPEESSEDSAYQAALELGSDFYGGGKQSDRARHRNFRKFIGKQDEYLLYKGDFVQKINQIKEKK